MAEVVILNSRVGQNVHYKRGELVNLSDAKAAFAVAQGWAKYTETEKGKVVQATSKPAEVRETQTSYQTKPKRTRRTRKTK
jgi:hypothetical protein